MEVFGKFCVSMKWIITNDKDFWKLQLTLPQLFADTYVNKCYFRNSQLITFFKLTSCIQSVVIWYPAVKPLLRKKKMIFLWIMNMELLCWFPLCCTTITCKNNVAIWIRANSTTGFRGKFPKSIRTTIFFFLCGHNDPPRSENAVGIE